jgi:hypothetical protein
MQKLACCRSAQHIYMLYCEFASATCMPCVRRAFMQFHQKLHAIELLEDIGHDAVFCAIRLRPHRHGVAVGVHADLCKHGVSSVEGFD